jgi:beta-galactosidase
VACDDATVGRVSRGTERASRLWERLGGLAYGGDYNPEQWDEATWAEDVKLMAEAGVNLVSLAIFGWATIQPGPETFDFSWLDRVMDLLGEAGVSVCLATATASPPPWLVHRHPEILPVDKDGRRLWHGSRQHYCPSSPVFRQAAARLVETLAERYGNHPALAAWHISNEYGCHVSRCYCDVSAEDFRRWLEARYGDLDSLNRAWSTAFWSQRYGSFDEIIPPRSAPTFPNPAQELDFSRFSSDAMLACFENEAAILDRLTPDVPITTNFLGIWKPVDGFAWAAHEDFVSHDSYPDPADPEAALGAAMVFDLMRGAKAGERWLLMEQAPSAVNWRTCNRPKGPGLYRLWSWQAIAHGSNGALSFQWRASRGGAEKYHSAMVPHAGPDHPIFREVSALGRELASVPEVARSRPARSAVALLFDWSSWWALELSSHPSSWLSALSLLRAFYEPFWRESVAVEIVHPSADLSPYRLAVVPNLYLMEDAWAERLGEFVQDGGHLLAGFFSGIVDGHDIVRPGAYPGALRDLLGIEVDQFWPLDVGETIGVRMSDGTEGTATTWSEEVRLVGAEALATFVGGELDGRPAATRATRGKGGAWYLSTLPEPELMARVVRELRQASGVVPVVDDLPSGTEATMRIGTEEEYLFLLNHHAAPATLAVEPSWRAAVGQAPAGGSVTLPPRGVSVLRRPLTEKH